MLGQNGTGKSTFIKMLGGYLKADNDEDADLPKLNISYKPQSISPKSEGTVRQLFHLKIREAFGHPQFLTDVVKPLQIDQLLDQQVQVLSGNQIGLISYDTIDPSRPCVQVANCNGLLLS